METTLDLSALLETSSWDAATVSQVRQAAFESVKQLDQFKSWVRKTAAQDDRASNLKAGISLLWLGQPAEAVELLKQAGEGELKRFYLALAYRELAQYDNALAELDRAEAKGYDAFAVAMARAETLVRAGRLDEAAKLIDKQAKSGDAKADFHYHRGRLLEQRGQLNDAADAYAKALELDAHHQGACFRLGYLHDLEGQDDEAVELYRRCVQTSPAMVHALINLAVIYEDRSSYDQAIRCLQEVLRVDPTHPRARLFLKDALAGLTQYYDEIQERARDKRTAVLEIPITDFELSVRSRNCLKKMNIHTLGDLLRVTENELLSYKNFGETSLNEIKAVLTQKGLRLGQAIEEEQGGPRRRPEESAGDPQVDDLLSKSVEDLELSVRSRRCLERLGLQTLGDLASRTEAELMAAKNFGQTSLLEVKQQLAAHGLSLREIEE